MSIFLTSPVKTLQFRPIFIITKRFLTSANPRRSSYRPTTAQYDELVNEAGRSGDLDELRQLLNRRVKDGLYNTSNTFNFVTATSTSTSAIGVLCETLARLDEGYIRKGAFDALVARLCKVGRLEESLHAVDVMARADCGPDARTFHPVIKALTRGEKSVDVAWRVVDRMRLLGASPDATCFNYFLTAHCAAGDVGKAAAVVERMVGQGVKADGRTYDALVLGACRAGRVEGALVVLRRMEEEGVPMLLSTRLYVVDALLSLGCYGQAVRFVRVYGGRDTWLDAESFGCLATRFIKMKRMEEAKLVLEEMRRRGLEIRGSLKARLNLL